MCSRIVVWCVNLSTIQITYKSSAWWVSSMTSLVASIRAVCHIWAVCTVGILVSVTILAWSDNYILNIVVDWQIDSWFLQHFFLSSSHQRWFIDRLLWNWSRSMWTMMTSCILVVEVLSLVLQIGRCSMSMVLVLVDTSVRLAWIVYMVSLTGRLSICSSYLLRVSSIFPCPDSSWPSSCSWWCTSRLIDTDELIYEIVEALLIITLGELLVTVVIEVLMQNLLKIFM